MIYDAMRAIIESAPSAKIDYMHIGDPTSLREMERVCGNVVVLLAVRIGATRLIDNILIEK